MKSNNNNPTMVPPKKRRKASSPTGSTVSSPTLHAQTPSTEENDQEKRKTARSKDEESPMAAPMMALPPPLMPYPHPPHPHFVVQSPYYPLYPPTPFYVPVGSSPPLPPLRGHGKGGSNSSSNSSNGNNNSNSKQPSGTPRILPKAPTAAECFPSPEYHPLYPHPHPYAFPISPPTLKAKQLEAMSTADQREQARKLSHSAIERRRRERINDKIVQLRQLIPSCADQEHLHKMTVLQSAIDYITYLKQVVSQLKGEERVHVSLKVQKTPKSMLPKEVEPFTTQFSVQQGKQRRSSESSTSSNSADQNDSAADTAKAMKPIDVIKAGRPIALDPPSAGETAEEPSSATWLPPPLKETASSPCSSSESWQDENKMETTSNNESALPTPLLTPRPVTTVTPASGDIANSSKTEASNSSSAPQTKHMSLQNILC